MSELKAFLVTENDENTGGVFFATHAVIARRLGANEYADGEFSNVSCRRAAWADRYAPGPVPWTELIRNENWWIECSGCGREIRADPDAPDEASVDDAVETRGQIYCTAACCERDLDQRAACMHAEAEAIDALRAEILRRWPGVTIGRMHAYVPHPSRPAEQVIVEFSFPGAKIGFAQLRIDRADQPPALYVCTGDLDAWHAFTSPAPAEAQP